MSKLETILLELEESENYAIMYLNRPVQLNSLNFQLAEDFYSALVLNHWELINLLFVINLLFEKAISLFQVKFKQQLQKKWKDIQIKKYSVHVVCTE